MAIAHSIAALVKQQTTTTGTGTLSLGTVPAGARSFVAGVGTGKTVRYHLYGSDGSFEHGEGVVAAGTPDTLSRVTVFSNSLGTTSKITLPVGTHTVALTNGERSIQESTPRALTIGAGVTVSAGIMTVDCMYACDVFFTATLPANITQIIPANVPERCALYGVISQPGAGGPYTLPQSAWPNGTTLETPYYVYTDTTKTRFWLTTTDGGASWVLECNAPLSLTLPQSNAAGTVTVDAAGIGDVVVNLTLTGDITTINRQNIPTNCRIRYETTQGAGGPWVIKDSAWGAGAVVDPYLTATTGKTVVVWETSDGGVTANVSGPNNGAISAAWVRRFGGIKMPATRYFDQSLLAVGSSNLVGVAGRIDLVPWVPWYDQTVDRLGVNVTTGVAGALGRVVIYGANANDEPDALLWLPATDLSLAAAAFVEHTQTLNFKKNVLYYIGFFHGSTATISSIQGFVLPNYGFSVSTSTSPGSVIRQTVTYPNAPANFGFIPTSHFSASSGPSIRMRAA